jgi:hypothetical protein
MLRIATVLLMVAVGLLATRVLSGTVAEVLPCEDNTTCLSDHTVAYEVTVPGWTTLTTVSFGSQAGTRLLVPRTGKRSQPAARALTGRAGAQASSCLAGTILGTTSCTPSQAPCSRRTA